MKNFLTVTVVDNQFVITESRMVVQNTELTRTGDYKELVELIKTSGYKSASFTEEAKIFKQSVQKAMRLANDTKRQEREAKKAARLAKQEERKSAQIAKLQAKLAKLQSA